MNLGAASVLVANTWTLVAGGDVMLNGVALRDPFAGIEPYVKAADVAYANLEIPLTSSTNRTSRKTSAEIAARTQYVLKAHPGHVKFLASAGFDVVSLANNHAMDYGHTGLVEMTKGLDANKIRYNGAGLNKSAAEKLAVVVTKSGLRVGLLSFLAFLSDSALYKCTPATDTKPGIAVLQFRGVVGKSAEAHIRSKVTAAKKRCDVLLVALHWGDERKTVPKPYQVSLGRAFLRSGADAVIGAHPHVLQGAESFAGKPLFYSLGNLVSPLGGSTGIVRMNFDGSKFQRAEFLPCHISGGKTKPINASKWPAAVSSFNRLSDAIQRSYKDTASKKLTVTPFRAR